MVMLIVDSVIYCLISWYLSQVLPNQYGLQRRVCFCFEACFKRGRKGYQRASTDEPTSAPLPQEAFVEAVPKSKEEKVMVEIRNLKKVFNKKTIAVDNLSFDIYKDEITSLL